jgi:hypothetical protein
VKILQEELYSLILETNKECVKLCKPGASIQDIHNYSVSLFISLFSTYKFAFIHRMNTGPYLTTWSETILSRTPIKQKKKNECKLPLSFCNHVVSYRNEPKNSTKVR